MICKRGSELCFQQYCMRSACCATACWQVFYEEALPQAAAPAPCTEQLRDVAAHVDGLSREVRGSSSREVQQMKLVEAELQVKGIVHLVQKHWLDLLLSGTATQGVCDTPAAACAGAARRGGAAAGAGPHPG